MAAWGQSLLATLQDAAEEGIQQILGIRAEHGAGEAGREGVQCGQAFRLDLLARSLEHLEERPQDELNSTVTTTTGLRLLPHFPTGFEHAAWHIQATQTC